MDPNFHKYMKHIKDLEEWNEGWFPRWEPPVFHVSNVVVVTQGFIERDEFSPIPDETERTGTAVATYKQDGTPISLFIYGWGDKDEQTTNYWAGSYHERLPDIAAHSLIMDGNKLEVYGEGYQYTPKKKMWVLIHLQGSALTFRDAE